MRILIYKALNFLSRGIARAGEYVKYKKSKLINIDEPRSLYMLPSNKLMLLNKSGYIDNQIITKGLFEEASTSLIDKFIKKGDVVIDVGANIGYYTIIFAELVGESGHVYAFEPTAHFRQVLKKNLDLNNLSNVTILDFGLSNAAASVEIDIGPSSATIHSPDGYDEIVAHEQIQLITFNEFVKFNRLDRIDFIKIDVDGHEPYFFEGAWEVLDSFDVIILFEISHLHYLEAGVFAWDFYEKVVSKGYNIFDETNLKKLESRNEFLRRCADFSSSSNVIISKRTEII